MTEALAGIGVILFLNVVGFAFWLGKIHAKLNVLCDNTQDIRKNIGQIYGRLDEHTDRIGQLEGAQKGWATGQS
jgi:hypothetical protein